MSWAGLVQIQYNTIHYQKFLDLHSNDNTLLRTKPVRERKLPAKFNPRSLDKMDGKSAIAIFADSIREQVEKEAPPDIDGKTVQKVDERISQIFSILQLKFSSDGKI